MTSNPPNALGPEISVVIPAHNEATGITHSLSEIGAVLESCGVAFELIVVDDGSKDRTFEVLRVLAAKDQRVRGIRLSRNFGKEGALLAGIRAARGRAVITMDADLQHPPALIPTMLKKWRQGAQVVHAVKRDRSADSLFQRWRAAAANGLIHRLGGIDVRNSSDFKLLDRTAVAAVARELTEKKRFYRGLAEWIGFRQAAVLFDVAPRTAGSGKWSPLALADLAVTAIVSFTTLPLRIVTLLGVVTLGFAVLVSAETLWSWLRGTAVSGFATLEITLLLLGSFIMVSLGILGEYVAKIYQEVKGRPPYLVSEDCGFSDPSTRTE